MVLKKDSLDIELPKRRFRVAIFGSARAAAGSKDYKEVFALGKKIAKANMDLVTGGGPGLMEAASKGFNLSKNGRNHSIGLTVKLPWEFPKNDYLDIDKSFSKFSDRLDKFMTLSNVVIIAPGGVGTCLEFFYTWQLVQVKHLCNTPVILMGNMWEEMIKWIKKWPIKKSYISLSDVKNLYFAKNNKEAFEHILKAYKSKKNGKKS